MQIKRVDDRSGCVTLGQFLEDAGLVLVLTATYDYANKPICGATIEKDGVRLKVTGGEHLGDDLVGWGLAEKNAINNLRDLVMSGSITKIGSVVVPKLRRDINGIID